MCRLDKTGIQHLLKHSLVNKNDPVGPLYQLTRNVPAVGVYLDPRVTEETLVDLEHIPLASKEDIPVCSIATTMYGGLGMLHTKEDYRRRGLGSLVFRVAGMLQAQQGYVPHAYADVDNSASLAMLAKMPGLIETHFATWMYSAKVKRQWRS